MKISSLDFSYRVEISSHERSPGIGTANLHYSHGIVVLTNMIHMEKEDLVLTIRRE